MCVSSTERATFFFFLLRDSVLLSFPFEATVNVFNLLVSSCFNVVSSFTTALLLERIADKKYDAFDSAILISV